MEIISYFTFFAPAILSILGFNIWDSVSPPARINLHAVVGAPGSHANQTAFADSADLWLSVEYKIPGQSKHRELRTFLAVVHLSAENGSFDLHLKGSELLKNPILENGEEWNENLKIINYRLILDFGKGIYSVAKIKKSKPSLSKLMADTSNVAGLDCLFDTISSEVAKDVPLTQPISFIAKVSEAIQKQALLRVNHDSRRADQEIMQFCKDNMTELGPNRTHGLHFLPST